TALAHTIAETITDAGYPASLRADQDDIPTALSGKNTVPGTSKKQENTVPGTSKKQENTVPGTSKKQENTVPGTMNMPAIEAKSGRATGADAPTELRMDVGGMTCASCVASVEKTLNQQDDVEE